MRSQLSVFAVLLVSEMPIRYNSLYICLILFNVSFTFLLT